VSFIPYTNVGKIAHCFYVNLHIISLKCLMLFRLNMKKEITAKLLAN